MWSENQQHALTHHSFFKSVEPLVRHVTLTAATVTQSGGRYRSLRASKVYFLNVVLWCCVRT